MDDLEILYPRASAACKASPERLEEARKATKELQAGRPGYRALWQHFRAVSFEGVRREFSALGVHFDWWKGESDVDAIVAPMVEDLRKRGLAEESEGALVIHINEPGDKKELPPLIVQKSDGAALYETTDLATIIDRVRTANPDLILYVVGQPQHDHFEKVFRGARKAGLNGKATLEHVGFGTVNGPDGKPFRTRAGGTVKLFDLIEQAKQEAQTRLNEFNLAQDYPPQEREEIARMVGLAAIKFADLSNHRLTNYVFDLARFTRFEGETGPYLQYAAVRIKSLLKKAEEQDFKSGAIRIEDAAERDLVLAVDRLPTAIDIALGKRAPNVLSAFAFELAQGFSRFYAAHHILTEPDATLRASRLAVCRLVLFQLEIVLGHLGIEVPERM
jgi:arginyl-tRNA synthetase